jgi:hypothetical protein
MVSCSGNTGKESLFLKSFAQWVIVSDNLNQSIGKNGQSDTEDGGVDQLVVFGQPVRQKNIKIVFGGIRIFPRHDGQGAEHLENGQYQTLQEHQAHAEPYPQIDLVGDYGIQQIKDHHVEEQPYQGVHYFDP